MSASGSQQPDQASRNARPGSWRRHRLFLGILVVLSLITLGLAAWQWLEGRQRLARQSRAAPPEATATATDFTLISADGTPVSLSDLRGKVVLLNFWATWCPPCTAEMPDLNALYRRYGGEKNFVVVGVNLEEQPKEVADFARQKHIDFPLLLDRDGRVTRKAYRVRTLPASVIIDREGITRDSWVGRLLREAMLARLEKVW
jgi:cytochrome c biogenesis protein CcmG/thiol:disulfide interchange protein DsbE